MATRRGRHATRTAPKVCIDRVLDRDELIAAGERALAERADNMPVLPPPPGASAPPRLRMALEAKKMWANGRTLRVAFRGGTAAMQQKVEHYARLWEQHANLRLQFGAWAQADIRITFDYADGGSWSYVGVDALGIAKTRATMNFGWLTPETDDQEYERVVVHEFGHAIGCVHEHQNPNANIPWDKPVVYAYYAQQGWSKQDVDANVFQKYAKTQVNATTFDPQSIMLYAVPNAHTIGDFEIGWNRRLSARDKQFIAAQYPKTAPAASVLTVDGPPVQGAVNGAGEVDRFRLAIGKKGRYRLETGGKTDVVLALYGPDDDKAWVAEDDDSGAGRNARLVVDLPKGRYVATVRHYAHAGSGAYTLRAARA